MRQLNAIDNFITQFDQCIRTLSGSPLGTKRSNPSDLIEPGNLSAKEKKLSANLMRINHTGEICAQALYQGQALTARDENIKQTMRQAAMEENDHLIWCQKRINELNSHTSYLNPLWWAGSFAIGVGAGILGDKWSLGFLAQTENQVSSHLSEHLNSLPDQDSKSRAVVEQMRVDEQQHETHALENGAATLPTPVPLMMRLMSKVMTSTVYYV
jgi:3-demethoxyubiquinol 3-hydroxylase